MPDVIGFGVIYCGALAGYVLGTAANIRAAGYPEIARRCRRVTLIPVALAALLLVAGFLL